MNQNSWKRPPSAILIIAILYIAVGAIGFVGHFRASLASPREGVWIELTEFLALLCGIFILRRQNWARWLAVAWIAFHVALSYGVLREFVVHSALCALIAWVLFRPEAAEFFGAAKT
jgi:hypothetical protein